MVRRSLTSAVAFCLLLETATCQGREDAPFRVAAVESVRLVEGGAILAEDFDAAQLDLSRWRVWQENPDRTHVRQECGRLTLGARGRIGHNGLWGLTTAKYKDVVLVGEMDIRSEGRAPHRLALHLCGGDDNRSPDHWVEIDLVDQGETARFSPMAALPLGLERQQGTAIELSHPAGRGFLCRLSLNGESNLVDLSVRTDKGWQGICPPIALPLRTVHTEVKLHGGEPAPDGADDGETRSQAWFDNVRIYPRPVSHHIGIRLVQADGRQIWFRDGEGWPPRIIDGQGRSRSIEDLEVQLWTADGQTRVASSRSANMAFYLLPLKDAPWDVYPVAAELHVLLDGRPLGKPLRIECRGLQGLYPDDVYDVVVSERGAASTRPAAPETMTVHPVPSSEVLLNPGKGWVLYGMAERQDAKATAIGALGYRRFAWSDLEPSEGQYNWKPLDDALASWHKAGKQFAFGVMCANSHANSPYVTPKWVFDAGAEHRLVGLSESLRSTSPAP